MRNRLKIESAIEHAAAFLRVEKQFGSCDRYAGFAGGKPRVNSPKSLRQIPARTAESDAISKDLKEHGFHIVGSAICYVFRQAVQW